MALICLEPPVVEPVTLAEAKLHCRIDVDDDDTLVASLISTAREHLEQISRPRVAMTAQKWLYVTDEWPADDTIELRPYPLLSVDEVRYTDDDGVETTIASSEYQVDTYSAPGRLHMLNGWPSATLAALNGLQIEFTAGYGLDVLSPPMAMRQAVLLLVGHWYENRELALMTGAMPKELPFAVKALFGPWRREV
jgi:uncharacterized phiE125 gp8 family phage protein